MGKVATTRPRQERLFQTFQYGEADDRCDFIWSDFADWYVEIAKQELAEGGRVLRAADTLARVRYLPGASSLRHS
jgi:valyl-tRNA synthetase